jgi:hypothetical protein
LKLRSEKATDVQPPLKRSILATATAVVLLVVLLVVLRPPDGQQCG